MCKQEAAQDLEKDEFNTCLEFSIYHAQLLVNIYIDDIK